MALKIKPEHYNHIKSAIAALGRDKCLDYKERLRTDSKVKVLEVRYRWDLLRFCIKSTWVSDNLYPYLNDNHIDSALVQIIKELNY